MPAQKPNLLNRNHLLVWHKIIGTGTKCISTFGLAQNILEPVDEGQVERVIRYLRHVGRGGQLPPQILGDQKAPPGSPPRFLDFATCLYLITLSKDKAFDNFDF